MQKKKRQPDSRLLANSTPHCSERQVRHGHAAEQVQRGQGDAADPRHRRRRVVALQREERPALLAGQHVREQHRRVLPGDLPDAVRPALLLVEVVRPGRRAFADRHHVRRVDALPLLAGGLVDRGVDRHAGQVVLDDRVLVAADLAAGRGPVQVVGADEQGRVLTVAAALDDAR